MPTIPMRGKQCYYQDRGTGFPLLLGHSYLWSSEMWEPQLQVLSQEYRCIVPDLWAHGQSDSLEEELSIESLAEDGWQLMQALGMDEFAVIGLSVGGMWGTKLALDHPKAVRALILMDTYVGSEPLATQKRYFALIEQLEKNQQFTPFLLDQIVPLFFSPVTLKHKPFLIEDFKHSLTCLSKEKIPAIAALGRAIFSRACLLEQLSSLKMPTLVVVGQDDIPRPPREAEEMVRYLGDGALAIVKEAGHISNLEQPEEVNELLSGFLEHKLPMFSNKNSSN